MYMQKWAILKRWPILFSNFSNTKTSQIGTKKSDINYQIKGKQRSSVFLFPFEVQKRAQKHRIFQLKIDFKYFESF
jgi:hypothetical protein